MLDENNIERGSNYGKTFSDETRERMSTAKKGKYTGSNSSRAKSILQIEVNTGKIIAVFDTAVEAEKETGTLRSSISQAARGNIPSAGGCGWMFASENEGSGEIGSEATKFTPNILDIPLILDDNIFVPPVPPMPNTPPTPGDIT